MSFLNFDIHVRYKVDSNYAIILRFIRRIINDHLEGVDKMLTMITKVQISCG